MIQSWIFKIKKSYNEFENQNQSEDLKQTRNDKQRKKKIYSSSWYGCVFFFFEPQIHNHVRKCKSYLVSLYTHAYTNNKDIKM